MATCFYPSWRTCLTCLNRCGVMPPSISLQGNTNNTVPKILMSTLPCALYPYTVPGPLPAFFNFLNFLWITQSRPQTSTLTNTIYLKKHAVHSNMYVCEHPLHVELNVVYLHIGDATGFIHESVNSLIFADCSWKPIKLSLFVGRRANPLTSLSALRPNNKLNHAPCKAQLTYIYSYMTTKDHD